MPQFILYNFNAESSAFLACFSCLCDSAEIVAGSERVSTWSEVCHQ